MVVPLFFFTRIIEVPNGIRFQARVLIRGASEIGVIAASLI